MKKCILFFIAQACLFTVKGQFFGASAGCQINVNHGSWAQRRMDVKDATFRIAVNFSSVSSYCSSATLINRGGSSDATLGDYFIIARHSLVGWDASATHTLVFNYQSPTTLNSDTPVPNRGIDVKQSYGSPYPTTLEGYEYFHVSKVELIAWYYFGDFALCRIETPIPPHFNVYYAGWSPAPYNIGPNGTNNVCGDRDYVITHHPANDIKKISGADYFYNHTNPTAVGCYWVTSIINVLFGWIWGQSTSLTQVCNYVDAPWLVVPYWCDGSVEKGSSGSGLLNSNDRYIGTLSGGTVICSNSDFITFGKFKNFYPASSVRNVLNPNNDLGLDIVGLGGRRINCFQNLDLPGAPGVSGQYFPANHYYDNNTIALQAVNDITTNAPIHIYSGANYEFSAGNSIEINPNYEFTVEHGAEFIQSTNGCYKAISSAKEDPSSNFLSATKNKIKNSILPKEKIFDLEEYKAKNGSAPSNKFIYPNPNAGLFNLQGNFLDEEIMVEIKEIAGKTVYRNQISNIGGSCEVDVQSLELANGIYILIAKTKTETKNFKLILNK